MDMEKRVDKVEKRQDKVEDTVAKERELQRKERVTEIRERDKEEEYHPIQGGGGWAEGHQSGREEGMGHPQL